MGFRSNNRTPYRPRPPKGPLNFNFGVVSQGAPSTAEATPPPTPVEPQAMARQELTGTLFKDKVNLKEHPDLPGPHLSRVLDNFQKIYEYGKYLNSSRSSIDIKDKELLVSFSFSQDMVDRMKGLDRNERAWDPDNKCWRVFPGCIDDVLDILGKEVRISEEAYKFISAFMRTRYYAVVAQKKIGKLIVRESWFEELELEGAMPVHQGKTHIDGASQSNGSKVPIPEGTDLDRIRGWIQGHTFLRKPFQHQYTGMEFLIANPAAALLDEMGCGKSFQIASSIAILLAQKEIERVLIVAPKSLIRTWQEELALACQIPFQVIEGLPAKRKKALGSLSPIFLIHYEGLRLEEEALAEWTSGGKTMLIFDESQRVKNLNAQTTQAALAIRKHAKRCVIATGTPIANRPLDLFAQYLIMDQGRSFGVKFPAFKNTFCILDIHEITAGRRKIKVEKFVGIKNGDELRRRIQQTSLRRLKSDVLDLPPILYKDYVVELKDDQRKMYMQMRDQMRVEIANMSEEEVSSATSNVMVKLLRLSQIASNPALLAPRYGGPNAKWDELKGLLEDILEDDTKKVILWSHFVENVNALQSELNEEWQPVVHTGELSTEERQAHVNRFRDDPTCRVFIATPQSAKEGLTLLPRDGRMKADTMIYLDLDFDAGSYIQSQARFHRIGQTADKCLVIHLIGEDTVDEYIRKTVIDKIQTAVRVLDSEKESNHLTALAESHRLNRKELIELLS